jgi:DNA-binding response OmpR family regulator
VEKKTILIVDSDEDFRQTLVEQLSLYEDFNVIEAENASKSNVMLRSGAIDLLIIDSSLPDMSGRDAVKTFRKANFKAPVIMFTKQENDTDKMLALEAGVNDYIAKPFRFAVLLSRIRAQLRQYENNEDVTLTIGSYIFKPNQKILIDKQGGKLRLTEKETSIIKYLYKTSHKVVTRDVLLNEVWGYNSGVTTHTLETHIYRLRQKIERDPSNAEIVVTEGGGYKLIS